MLIAQTERLILRRWLPGDRQPFAQLNADPRVTEFLAETLSTADSDALAARIESHFNLHGFGLCAVEYRVDGSFIGFIGLAIPTFQSHFTPCVEIGWRLSADHWGLGLATEGAREMTRYAFEELGLKELVSFTATTNMRSRRVMEKLGMTHETSDDFDHPRLPVGHPLRRQVLYRLQRGMKI